MGKMARARPQPSAATDLDQVLDTERRLATLLAQAEADARQLIAAARLRAEALEQAAPGALDQVVERLRSAEAGYQAAEIAKIRQWLTRESARYREVDPDRVSRLADLAIQRLIEGGP